MNNLSLKKDDIFESRFIVLCKDDDDEDDCSLEKINCPNFLTDIEAYSWVCSKLEDEELSESKNYFIARCISSIELKRYLKVRR